MRFGGKNEEVNVALRTIRSIGEAPEQDDPITMILERLDEAAYPLNIEQNLELPGNRVQEVNPVELHPSLLLDIYHVGPFKDSKYHARCAHTNARPFGDLPSVETHVGIP